MANQCPSLTMKLVEWIGANISIKIHKQEFIAFACWLLVSKFKFHLEKRKKTNFVIIERIQCEIYWDRRRIICKYHSTNQTVQHPAYSYFLTQTRFWNIQTSNCVPCKECFSSRQFYNMMTMYLYSCTCLYLYFCFTKI